MPKPKSGHNVWLNGKCVNRVKLGVLFGNKKWPTSILI